MSAILQREIGKLSVSERRAQATPPLDAVRAALLDERLKDPIERPDERTYT